MQKKSSLFKPVTRTIFIVILFTLLEITTAYSERPTKNNPLISCESCHLKSRAHYKVGKMSTSQGGYHTNPTGYEPNAQGSASSAPKPAMISDGADIAVDGNMMQ